MHILENEKVRLAIDSNGLLQELTNKATGFNYAGGSFFWRVMYQAGKSMEDELCSYGQPEVALSSESMTLLYDETENEELAFRLSVTIDLCGDEFQFAAKLENCDTESLIREFQFPMVGTCGYGDQHALIWSHFGGQRFREIRGAVRSRHTQYMALDNKEVQMATNYPGPAAMNCFALAAEGEGLYFGSHDESFQLTQHYLGQSQDGTAVGMIKYPYLKPGEKTTLGGFVLSPYTGSWHVASQKYRTWADQWFEPVEKPESILNMNGWQRLIMRHQYGRTLYRYDQLKEILEDGMTAGIDTLFMFGWHDGGHDAAYPDYGFDEDQGGRDALKANIRKFQDGGGKVILYFNGRLIDAGTPYYQEIGKRICVKRPDGTEHSEFYPFGADGTGLRLFGNKSFVVACLACQEWMDKLKEFVDIAIDLDCDGVFFDQLGLMPGICHDPSHGHDVPFTTHMATVSEKVQELRTFVKSRRPEMSLGIEWISDVTARHVDFVHTILCGTEGSEPKDGKRTPTTTFLDFFYYTFPEVAVSDRSIRDDTDIERRVNFALLKGLRSDVEIYRCRSTIRETPHYQAYLAKANVLREKYRDLILNGRFCDNDHFSTDNPEISSGAFTAEDRLAVILTQSHLENASTVLTVPGYGYLEHHGLGDYSVEQDGDDLRVRFGKHGLVVAIFRRA